MPKRGIPDFQRQQARQLRRRPSLAESRLWSGLRQLRRQGIAHFRRQAPIGPHIVDFVDLKRRIIVEADGGRQAGDADRPRDIFLEREGYLVLRFCSEEILGNVGGVLVRIDGAVRGADPPTPIPSPRGGGERPRPSRCDSLPLGGRARVGGAARMADPEGDEA